MDTVTLNNILSKAFAVVGHPEDQYEDLTIMFYSGMMGQIAVNTKITALENELEKLMDKPESDKPSDDLLHLWNLIHQYNLESEVIKEFTTYLTKYAEHVKPSLENKKRHELDTVLTEASTLLCTQAQS